MRFWESVQLGLGLLTKGVAPTGLIVDKFVLDGGPLKMEWKSISEITNDEVRIANILGDTFIEKRILHDLPEKEGPQYVLKSASELWATLNEIIKGFHGSVSEIDRFYGSILIYWKSVVKRLKDEVEDAISIEERDRADYRNGDLIDSGDILRAQTVLPEILLRFRKNSYPVISLLIDLLPEKNTVAFSARKQLAIVKSQLELYFANTGDPLLEPEWSIEF